jgi:hypothetical protein
MVNIQERTALSAGETRSDKVRMGLFRAYSLRLAEETEQGIAQQVNRGSSDDQGEDGAVEENSRRSLVKDSRGKLIGSGSDENAHE